MPRYKLIIEYDGHPFVGWQRQKQGLSVQEALETAAEKFCHTPVSLYGAGRTDAGVHALGQVAHGDFPASTGQDTIRDALNYHLAPHPVCVLRAQPVSDDFHARFDALKRIYRYRIINRRAPLSLEAGRAWRVATPLDSEKMQLAANHLIGQHDFTAFRSTHCMARSPLKTLDKLEVRRIDDTISIEAEAQSFMHNQVRIMVGTLKQVGEGRWTCDEVKNALETRDRTAAGPTAPAYGLYLINILY